MPGQHTTGSLVTPQDRAATGTVGAGANAAADRLTSEGRAGSAQCRAAGGSAVEGMPCCQSTDAVLWGPLRSSRVLPGPLWEVGIAPTWRPLPNEAHLTACEVGSHRSTWADDLKPLERG